jgi:hypothetical protein
MQQNTTGKAVCVIVLGTEAKRHVEIVFPQATAFPSFASWQAGMADRYIDAALRAAYPDSYRLALQEAVGLAPFWQVTPIRPEIRTPLTSPLIA